MQHTVPIDVRVCPASVIQLRSRDLVLVVLVEQLASCKTWYIDLVPICVCWWVQGLNRQESAHTQLPTKMLMVTACTGCRVQRKAMLVPKNDCCTTFWLFCRHIPTSGCFKALPVVTSLLWTWLLLLRASTFLLWTINTHLMYRHVPQLIAAACVVCVHLVTAAPWTQQLSLRTPLTSVTHRLQPYSTSAEKGPLMVWDPSLGVSLLYETAWWSNPTS